MTLPAQPQERAAAHRPALRLVQPACHTTDDTAAAALPGQITVALAGQPNVGKSTVFNMLTGLNQHVGNWPGKTIEQKTGTFRFEGETVRVVDLPGAYSLTAHSEEERIARDHLRTARPHVVMAIVNAAQLEHSLYLVAELMTMGLPLVVGLNLADVAEQHGIRVEPHVLEAALGVPVVRLVAARNVGIRELVAAAIDVARNPARWQPNPPAIRAEHRPVLETLRGLIAPHAPDGYEPEWLALKLLEGDSEVTGVMKAALPAATWAAVHAILLEHEDAYLDIAGGRYEWIGRMMRAAVVSPRAGAITVTDRIDRVATHPVLGLLTLLALFGAAFWLTYAVATPAAEWLTGVVLGGLASAASAALSGAPAWVTGLVVDGVINGVGTVLTFLPVLAIFFALLAVLEDVGYLARGAYVMDRFMHLMGLHGKSFMPLFLGFGCNVPAVLGARILEERRARFLTILLAPLVPCTARLAVLAFLAPAFFGGSAALASSGIIALNLIVLAVAGVLVNRLAFKGEQTAFIMELPLYHAPNPRTVGLYVWNHAGAFVRKAGTFILLSSVGVWALSTLPGGNIETSVLATVGRLLQPLGGLMGLEDWRMIVALLSSFFAKENTIATLGVLFGAPEQGVALATQVATVLTPAARVAFLAVAMLFIPCLATAATIRQETRSWRWLALSLGLLLVISFAAGIVIYQVGVRL